MHNNLPIYFTFISSLDKEYIRKLDKKIAIIYRNYSVDHNKNLILEIKNVCKETGRKFFLSNDLKLAIMLDLDGVYLPSFYQKLNIKRINTRQKFIIIGSAHSVIEIRIKERQGASLIFLSPLFKTNKKKFLNPVKFNLLSIKTTKKIIALGGITSKNLKNLNMIRAFGFAAISYFENNGKITI